MAANKQKLIEMSSALQKRRASMSPEQKHADLVVFVGRIMAVCFAFTIFSFIYGVLFVDQPMEQSPTDGQLIDLLSTLLVFLTGSLSALLASNGLKNKKPAKDDSNEAI